MSNQSDQLSPASRAMIAAALIGGGASTAKQWQAYRQQEVDLDEATRQVLTDAVKAGAIGGLATAVAGAMAGRPLLSMLALLSVGAAGMHLMDEIKGNNQDEEA